MSGRLIASGVTGIPSRIRLAGAQSYRHGPGQRRRGSGSASGRVSCAGRGNARNAVSVATENAARCAVGGAVRRVARGNRARERGSEATNAGRGERKGAWLQARPLCALVGGATAARRRSAPAVRLSTRMTGSHYLTALPERGSGATFTGRAGCELPVRVDVTLPDGGRGVPVLPLI